mmetsp:Transcript_3121/g.5335  ORF Transcript_3121/g.5335 Transcript_3121/m.5335 type:complete len:81 (-) Transcript_3121:288-530(-)
MVGRSARNTLAWTMDQRTNPPSGAAVHPSHPLLFLDALLDNYKYGEEACEEEDASESKGFVGLGCPVGVRKRRDVNLKII